jgi:hypothetical protein
MFGHVLLCYRRQTHQDFLNRKAAVRLTEIFDGMDTGIICIDQLIQVAAYIQLTATGSWRDLSGSILVPCSEPEGSGNACE